MCPALHSQELSGLVLDSQTGEALIGASVFFNGSSLGTVTDQKGRFHLFSPFKTHAPLIISYLGYRSARIADPFELKDHTVYLDEYIQPIPEVVVTSDPFTRKQKLAVFRKEFLGDDRASRNCRILNEDVISLSFNSFDNTLTARARAPLFIVNPYLGYVIHFDLREFSIAFKTKSLKRIDNISYTRYAGFTRFEDVSENGNRVLRRRQKAYLGSPMHFMRSLWEGDLKAHDFSLKYEGESVEPDEIIQRLDREAGGFKTFRFTKSNVVVYYQFRLSYRSSLRLDGNTTFSIDRFGNYTPYRDLIFAGYMADLRMADLLPMDYMPKKSS